MSKLYETIGTNNPTYLLADPLNAELIAVPCEPGNGTVKRGTIMYKKESGLYAPAAAANAITSNSLVVLDETVDTTGREVTGGTVAEDARAYRSGNLVRDKVTLASDAAVTEAVELVLRKQGIVLSPMIATSAFNNVVSE